MSGRGTYLGQDCSGGGRGPWSARYECHFPEPVLITGQNRNVVGDYFIARFSSVDEAVLGLVRGIAASTFGVRRG